MARMHTDNQKKLLNATDEELEASLKKIAQLYDALDDEVDKWVARDDYSIANDLSGGHGSINCAIRKLHEQRSLQD